MSVALVDILGLAASSFALGFVFGAGAAVYMGYRMAEAAREEARQ